MKFHKINRILTVIKSCKTNEQLESCTTWIKSIKYITKDTSTFCNTNEITKLQLEQCVVRAQIQMLETAKIC